MKSARQTPRRRLSPPRALAQEKDGLLALPADIIALVLMRLPPAFLGRLLQVCRTLCSLAAEPALWRAHCLDIWPDDVFESGPPSPARYGSRCALFRGIVLCGTALGSQNERAAIVVAAMGGSWDSALTSDTTHLLCGANYVRERLYKRARGVQPLHSLST